MMEITEREFAEWQAYFRLEPWGTSAIEQIAASHAMNSLRGKADYKQLFPISHADIDYQQQQIRESSEAANDNETKMLIAQARAIEARERAASG